MLVEKTMSLFWYLCTLYLGKKRVFIPDEKEAYIEVEVKDVDGDKATVETRDGRVSGIACF